ncbi:MAG: M23 family metallopeptidase [Ignavibacteria bacterium]|jgi:murein DD-endopeptidase MepM/ murein hydrolase activator NlpD
MKSFYYFSRHKLKFVEVKNFYRKFIFLIVFFSILSSFVLFSGFFIIREIINPNAEVEALQNEKMELTEKLEELSGKFTYFETTLDSLNEINNYLRMSVNLEPLSDEDRNFGTGGSVFENFNPANSRDVKNIISHLDNYTNKIELKIKLEQNNFDEISKTLEVNKKLYESIPAIKPAIGPYGSGFGMRMHPILKIRRMHHGIDIVVDVGTDVFAPGNGKIEFAGRKGSSGITIVIDHGFGYKTYYRHLTKLFVRKGNTVKRGDKIALSGNTGLSTGPHLHYEVHHNGISLNPRNFIYDDINIFEFVENTKKSE